MSRTRKDRKTDMQGKGFVVVGETEAPRWRNPGTGRWWKRRYHKAVRQWKRRHGGRERCAIHAGRECEWKLM